MWDVSLANVYEAYPIDELDTVNVAMGMGKYGECTKIGVGYCTTKPSFGVDSREQLTMCGIQDFEDGSSIIWGTEMESQHDHLLPEDEARRTRAKSHLFATTLIPTGKDTFDVEYVIQLGKFYLSATSTKHEHLELTLHLCFRNWRWPAQLFDHPGCD